MATQVNGPGSYAANAAMSAFRAVVLSSNRGVGLAPNTAVPLGFIQQDVASGDYVAVKFFSGPGTHKASITVAPVTVGDVVFAGANGQVSTTGTITVGQSQTTASANGSIIEINPIF